MSEKEIEINELKYIVCKNCKLSPEEIEEQARKIRREREAELEAQHKRPRGHRPKLTEDEVKDREIKEMLLKVDIFCERLKKKIVTGEVRKERHEKRQAEWREWQDNWYRENGKHRPGKPLIKEEEDQEQGKSDLSTVLNVLKFKHGGGF
jgi:hypothetical protein